jgi:hypothetical protein
MKRNKNSTAKYWYFTTEYECVLCCKIEKFIERQYTPKPKEYWERHVRYEMACESHFM